MPLEPNPTPYFPTNRNQPIKADDFVLDSYIMHIETQQCKCGNIEKISRFFELWVNPRLVSANGQRMLKPVTTQELKGDLLVGHSLLKPRQVPMCSACVTTHTDPNLPKTTTLLSPVEWERTLRRKYAPEEKKAQPAPKPASSPKPTLDDL